MKWTDGMKQEEINDMLWGENKKPHILSDNEVVTLLRGITGCHFGAGTQDLQPWPEKFENLNQKQCNFLIDQLQLLSNELLGDNDELDGKTTKEAGKMNNYYITMVNRMCLHFVGKYRPDLENDDWHCYEDEKGIIIHFYKSNIMYVKMTQGAPV